MKPSASPLLACPGPRMAHLAPEEDLHDRMCSLQPDHSASTEGSDPVEELVHEVAAAMGLAALAAPAAAPMPPPAADAGPPAEPWPPQRLPPQMERAWSSTELAGGQSCTHEAAVHGAAWAGRTHRARRRTATAAASARPWLSWSEGRGVAPGANNQGVVARKRSASEMEQLAQGSTREHRHASLPASSSLLELAAAAESGTQVPLMQLLQQPCGPAPAATVPIGTPPIPSRHHTHAARQPASAGADVLMRRTGRIPAAQAALQHGGGPAMRRAAPLADASGNSWPHQLLPALDARTPPQPPQRPHSRVGSQPGPPLAPTSCKGDRIASKQSRKVVRQALRLQQELADQRQRARELARQQAARLPLAEGLGSGNGVCAGKDASCPATALVGLQAVKGSPLVWQLRFLACPAASTLGAVREVRGLQ
jgi:hypothetical protein